MAMANDKPAPNWRNVAVWGAVGAVGYMLVASAGTAILNGKGMGELLRIMVQSRQTAAILGLGLILAVAVTGFTSRKRPVSVLTFRNFVIRDAVVMGVMLLFIAAFGALGRAGDLRAMGASEWAAVVTGSVLFLVAVLGTFVTASAHTSANLIDDEVAADDMRERGRLFLYSFIWTAACGLLLILLGLAGPGRVVSQSAALAGASLLIGALIVLGIAASRLSDELGRTLSRETGHIAFYLILFFGGGWAMLAHLGFVAGPAPLDWLTLSVILLFAASFIAAGRRKLLTR
ncbi:MAG: hypothetical protein ABIS51_14325 [Sphingomonas sp.]